LNLIECFNLSASNAASNETMRQIK
jgi:hypothetical protein